MERLSSNKILRASVLILAVLLVCLFTVSATEGSMRNTATQGSFILEAPQLFMTDPVTFILAVMPVLAVMFPFF